MILAGGLFVMIFGLTLAAALVAGRVQQVRTRKQVAGMLETVDNHDIVPPAAILRELNDQSAPLARLLSRLNIQQTLEARLRQSGTGTTVRQFLMNTCVVVVFGAVVGWMLPVDVPGVLRAAVGAGLAGMLPWMDVNRRRTKRMAECEAQLPEALDFLARSMRAGHAFTISLEMLSQETANPLGSEFRTLFNEQNLGASIETAMRNLTDRVPALDVRFFASAVLLQRQTGGNLGEILTRLSWVIRERFRLRGQVKAASAHARLTAMILCALPLATMFGMLVAAPGYLQGMANDPDGKWLIGFSIVGQIIGNIVIRKIIDIEV